MVDTLRAVVGFQNENDNAEIAREMAPWISLSRRAGLTLICLHHARKAGGEDGMAISGGHALFGTFDVSVEIARDGEYRKLTHLGRYGAQPNRHYSIDVATGKLTRRDVGELAAAKREERESGLLAALFAAAVPLTKSQVAEAVGLAVRTIDVPLKALVEAGDVSRNLGPGRGRAFEYRLNPECPTCGERFAGEACLDCGGD